MSAASRIDGRLVRSFPRSASALLAFPEPSSEMSAFSVFPHAPIWNRSVPSALVVAALIRKGIGSVWSVMVTVPVHVPQSAACVATVGVSATARASIRSTFGPTGIFHVVSPINFPIPGFVLELPRVPGLPNPSYRPQEVMRWEGGEAKYGIWRQYFNSWENSWTLAYNTAFNYDINKFGPRDSGNPSANVAAFMRFNVAEGDSGTNNFAVGFAPPGPAGTIPDFHGGGGYIFFDGRRGDAKTSRPVKFQLGGPKDVDSVVSITNDVMGVSLMVDGVAPYPNKFRIRDIKTGADYLVIQTPNGNVGIGTVSPQARLQVGNPGDGSEARANAWNLTSSRAYKTGIRPLGRDETAGLVQKVKDLEVVRYHQVGDASKKEHLGVIAEDAPREIVSSDGASVSMGDYVSLLLVGLKAQQSRIEELERRLAALEHR